MKEKELNAKKLEERETNYKNVYGDEVKKKNLEKIHELEMAQNAKVMNRQNAVKIVFGKPKMVRSEKEALKKVEKKKEQNQEERDLTVYMDGFVNLPVLLSAV